MSRRISRWLRTGLIQRAVAASPRLVSQPNASGSRRSGRRRICCMNSPNSAGGSLPVSTSVLPVRPGREVVERVAGDEHDPADARGAVAGEQLDERPAGVVADERDVVAGRGGRGTPRPAAPGRAATGRRRRASRGGARRAAASARRSGARGTGRRSRRPTARRPSCRPRSSTIAGPSPPVSSYSIVPADSSIWRVIAAAGARAGAGAGRTVGCRRPVRDRPGTARSARPAGGRPPRGERARRRGRRRRPARRHLGRRPAPAADTRRGRRSEPGR